MRTISAVLSLAALVTLATGGSAQSNSETAPRSVQSEAPDGWLIKAEKRSLNAIPVEVIAPGITRQVLHGTQSTFSRWELKAGSVVPLHYHVNEQITWIISGRAEVLSGGQTHHQALS